MNIVAVIVGINHWDDVTHVFLDTIFRYEEAPRIILLDNFSNPPYAHDRCWVKRSPQRLGFPAAINMALAEPLIWDKAIVFNNDCWAAGKFIDKVKECDENTFYGSKWNQPVNNIPLVYSAWMVISRKIWETVGQFDESLDAGWEDFDYEIRCHNAGFGLDVLNIPVEHIGKGTRFEEADYKKRWDICRHKYGDKHGVKTVKMDGKED